MKNSEIITKSGKRYKITENNLDEVLDKIGNEPHDLVVNGVVCFSFGGVLNF